MSEEKASLTQDLRALPRAAWILFFGTFLNKFGTFVLPFLAIYMSRLGYTTGQAGVAIGAYGVGSLCACLIGGWLADNFGRRKTIVWSMFSVSIFMLCLSQARSFQMIILLAALAGFAGELYRPAASALLVDLVPAEQRVTAFAAYRLAFNAGWAFGPAVAGLMAQASFTWLFVMDGLTSVLYGFVALFALPAGAKAAQAASSLRETFTVLRQDVRFQQVLLSSLVIGMVFVQVFSSMSLEITNNGFSPSVYGLIISLNGLLVVLFELPLTIFTRRYAPRRIMAFGYVLIGLGFASNLLPRTIPLLVLTTLGFTIGEMISMPISTAYVASLAPASSRGLYMGAYGMVWSLAFVCGPGLGMALFSLSSAGLWFACGLFGLIAAAIILAKPPQRQDLLSAIAVGNSRTA